ncbi:MAG: glycoside hydrolase family 3 N-terminal domain-containing protein [Fusicatenibacter sp.]
MSKWQRNRYLPVLPLGKDGRRVTEQCSALAVPHKLPKRLLSDGTYEELPMDDGPTEEEGLPRQDKHHLEGFVPETKAQPRVSFFELSENEQQIPQLPDVAEGRMTLDELISHISTDELIDLLGGQPNTGAANTFGMGNLPKYGIPNIMTTDGPAGLRINPECGIYTTAWPCATLLACTWDPDLIEQVGASVKHFACNNKETNRKDSDSRVSERALRELYLKAFEIIVKESDPYTIMSSYNLINGVQASENRDLLTGILRQEWGFRGMVTTDWWTHGEHYREAKAGNDIKMANGYPERIREALDQGYITREEIELCAKRILEMILRMD